MSGVLRSSRAGATHPSGPVHMIPDMKKKGKSALVTLLSVGLTKEERKVLEAEAKRRHVSLSLIVREALADEVPGFAEVTTERLPIGGSPYASGS